MGQQLPRHQQRRDRIARQADHRFILADGDDGRFARFGRQSVLQHARRAQTVDDIAGVIARGDRAARAEQQDFTIRESGTGASAIVVQRISRDAEPKRLRAMFLRQSAEGIGIDIAHLAGTWNDFWRDQFIAAAEDADARPPQNRDLTDANGQQAADILRSDAMMARQDQRIFSHILAGLDDIFAGRDRFHHFNLMIAEALRQFHHHHGIGAARQHAAGVNLQCLAAANLALRNFAHFDFADNLQERRQRLAGAESIGGAQGIAIDGAFAERWRALRREDILGSDATQRIGGGDDLASELRLPMRIQPIQSFKASATGVTWKNSGEGKIPFLQSLWRRKTLGTIVVRLAVDS